MTVKIKETGETRELIIMSDGINYFGDFASVGAWGQPGQTEFELSDDGETYIISQGDYEWWSDVINQAEQAEELLNAYREAHSDEEYHDMMDRVGDGDMDTWLARVQNAIASHV